MEYREINKLIDNLNKENLELLKSIIEKQIEIIELNEKLNK